MKGINRIMQYNVTPVSGVLLEMVYAISGPISGARGPSRNPSPGCDQQWALLRVGPGTLTWPFVHLRVYTVYGLDLSAHTSSLCLCALGSCPGYGSGVLTNQEASTSRVAVTIRVRPEPSLTIEIQTYQIECYLACFNDKWKQVQWNGTNDP